MSDAPLPAPSHLRLVASRDITPDHLAEDEDKALLALMSRLPPTHRRILATVMSRVDQLQDDEDAAVAVIERVMSIVRRTSPKKR